MDAKENNAMTQYNKITALYSRLSVGDEDRDGGESNSIVNQKAFLERYARQEELPNIRHYIDDDESGRTLSECCNEWQDKYSLKGMESGA